MAHKCDKTNMIVRTMRSKVPMQMHETLHSMMEHARMRLIERCTKEQNVPELMLLHDYDCERMDGDPDVALRIAEEVGMDRIKSLYKEACHVKTGIPMHSESLDATLTKMQINRLLKKIT